MSEYGIDAIKALVSEVARTSRALAKVAEDGTISGSEILQVLTGIMVNVVPKYAQFKDLPNELKDLSPAEVQEIAQYIQDQDWWQAGYDRAEQVVEAVVEWLACTHRVAVILLQKD